MTLGLLEYLIVTFEGNQFTGQIFGGTTLYPRERHHAPGRSVRYEETGISNKSAAGMLLFERARAIGLKEAIKHAGGVAVAGGLVVPDVLQALEADLEAAKQRA